MELKRKIYDRLLKWKKEDKGTTALLIEGARRIGKSTITEKFGRENYKSFVVIDFGKTNNRIKKAFQDYLDNLDIFFQTLMLETNVEFYQRDTLLIFDEIQKFPRAREALKYLIEDGRYDYIATGSLISIKENVDDIILPSEVEKIQMYPLDFEEFLLAANQKLLLEYIKKCFDNKVPLEEEFHKKAMRLFQEYIIVGGMPQSVVAYFENNLSFFAADRAKRRILELYKDDIRKSSKKYNIKANQIFSKIPSYLSKHEKRVTLTPFGPSETFEKYKDPLFWLEDSMICNLCYRCTDPQVGEELNVDDSKVKCYMGDTGLLISHTFSENELTQNQLFKDIINGKLAINKGMFYENIIAQMIVAKGKKLYYYTEYSEEKKRNDMEIDFLVSSLCNTRYKIIPIEVKSSKNFTTTSYNKFKQKFNKRIGDSYIISPKPFSKTENGYNIPPYMVIFLFND